MLKTDRWIIEMAEKHGMIEPFAKENVGRIDGFKAFSFGVQPYGYGLRLSRNFLIPRITGNILDSKHREFDNLETGTKFITVPPREYIIGFTIETIRVPEGIVGLIYGKSSLSEVGILVNAMPVNAGFEGVIRLCIVNLNHVPVRIYPHEGVAQILFFESDSATRS